MLLWMTVALAGWVPAAPAPPAPPEPQCETSARWQKLDESVLDRRLKTGHHAVPVAIGCHFLGVPGAVIDVGSDALLAGMEVVGIRRGQGMVLVQAVPAQAAAIEALSAPVAVSLVRDGDWLPLIYSIEGL